MEEIKNLGLYDLSRSLLLQTESLSVVIAKIKNKKLRIALDESLKTAQADLMVFVDIISQAESCLDDLELQEFLSTLG